MFSGFTTGSVGANQVWNYSALVPATSTSNPATGVENIAVSSAPYYWSFPESNYCQKISYTYNSLLFENYSFSKISSSAIEALGSSNSAGVSSVFTNTRMIPLPLNYGDTYTDSYQTNNDSSPFTINGTYDAYGSLTTPFGTFTNVARIKEVGNTYTVYSWVRTSPYIPLMNIHVDNESGVINTITIYQIISTLGINESTTSLKPIVYPNPAADYINLQLPENQVADKVRVTDLTGKILFDASNVNRINVESLAVGAYLLQVELGGNVCHTKFLKQ
ncbi:MAG: T9SS type A sorting domain-containing protein [Phycisphaerales bacterium]